jgi:hypothetical protein
VGSAPASRQATFGVIWARWIYLEIYNLHAALRLGMAGTDQPGSFTELGVADLGQEKTTALACPRQSRLAFAANLIGQGFLLPLRVAEDDRAQLARMAAYMQGICFRMRIACPNKL